MNKGKCDIRLILIFLRGSYLLYKLLEEEPRILDALPSLMLTLYMALLLFYSVFHGRANILDDKEQDFYTSKICLPAIKRETLIPLPGKQNKTITTTADNNKKPPQLSHLAIKFYHFRISEKHTFLLTQSNSLPFRV